MDECNLSGSLCGSSIREPSSSSQFFSSRISIALHCIALPCNLLPTVLAYYAYPFELVYVKQFYIATSLYSKIINYLSHPIKNFIIGRTQSNKMKE